MKKKSLTIFIYQKDDMMYVENSANFIKNNNKRKIVNYLNTLRDII